jgi:toxin-antitoxin system PIN domain toxin
MSSYLCDTNVWLALAIARHVHHEASRAWLAMIETPSSVYFCRATQQSFLRLVTSGSVFAPYGLQPLTNADAWAAYRRFQGDERIGVMRDEPVGLEQWWVDFATRSTSSPNLWMDAYLAAFARAASLTFVTNDRAFLQFDGLDVVVLGEGSAPESN